MHTSLSSGSIALIGAGGPYLRRISGPLGKPSLKITVPEGLVSDEETGKAITEVPLAPSDVICAVLAVGAASVELASGHTEFSLNNLIACLIATDLLQLLGLRSFRAAALLLAGMLAYDAFWVFARRVTVLCGRVVDVPQGDGNLDTLALLLALTLAYDAFWFFARWLIAVFGYGFAARHHISPHARCHPVAHSSETRPAPRSLALRVNNSNFRSLVRHRSPKAVGDNVMLAVATSDLFVGPTRILFPRIPGGTGDRRFALNAAGFCRLALHGCRCIAGLAADACQAGKQFTSAPIGVPFLRLSLRASAALRLPLPPR